MLIAPALTSTSLVLAFWQKGHRWNPQAMAFWRIIKCWTAVKGPAIGPIFPLRQKCCECALGKDMVPQH